MLLVVVIGNGLCIAAGQPKASGHHQTGNQAQDQNFHVILLCSKERLSISRLSALIVAPHAFSVSFLEEDGHRPIGQQVPVRVVKSAV